MKYSTPSPSDRSGWSPRRITLSAMLAALALIFSYIEVIFPFYTGIPGVKLGLANLVVVVALYKMSPSYAITINVVRVLMAGLLFSGLFGMLYSLAGSICSFLIMYLCWRSGLFSVLGVSLAGGVFHNLGQLAVAAFAVSNARIFFYFPVLIFSGMAAGIIVGIGSWVLISHLPDQIFRRY